MERVSTSTLLWRVSILRPDILFRCTVLFWYRLSDVCSLLFDSDIFSIEFWTDSQGFTVFNGDEGGRFVKTIYRKYSRCDSRVCTR